jgi:hypothetical protein
VGGACGSHGRGEESVQGFGGKAPRKIPLRRPRRRCEVEIRIDLKEIVWGVQSELSWLRIGTDGSLLIIR